MKKAYDRYFFNLFQRLRIRLLLEELVVVKFEPVHAGKRIRS